MMMDLVYKVVTRAQWDAAVAAGSFAGAPVDLVDGYIHLSAADQVDGTLARHFAGQADLLLVAVDARALGDALRWEPSRGGALFPHLYARLDLTAVVRVTPILLTADGSHVPDIELAVRTQR